MLVNLNVHRQIGRGVYATILEVDGRALKLFFTGPKVLPTLPFQSAGGRRKTYESECNAYLRAGSDPVLRKHIATFYGSRTIEDVIDSEGKSIGKSFLLDCCYELELLTGHERKTADVLYNYTHLRDIKKCFAEVAIDILDSSVFDYEDAARFKLIDFNVGRL